MTSTKMRKMSEKTIIKKGISGTTILFIVLFLLKVGIGNTSVQDWSWWLITLPLWGGLALFLGILIIVLVVLGIIGLIAIIVD